MNDKPGPDHATREQAQVRPHEAGHADFAPVPLPADDFDDGPEGPRAVVRHWLILAAMLLAGLLLTSRFPLADADTYTVRTAAGERQTIALADGAAIELGGGSHVVLDRHDPRRAELVSGKAHFSVACEAGEPFVVTVGEDRLVSCGTVLEVLREDRRLRVEVAQGAARYEGRDTVDLSAGDTLQRTIDETLGLPRSPLATIGDWLGDLLP